MSPPGVPDDRTDLFLDLTPDWVLKAVEAGGFEPTGHVMALHCLENRVYDLKLEDGSHIVTKFYRPGRWSETAIREEHAFLSDLREAEIPVCAPLAFADGQTVHTVEGIHYAVWPRTGGRSPEELDDEQVAILGRLVGRIHNVGALRPVEQRPTL
ncbi:MAG: phosphotransferase, partial [Myxococcota bacterium]